MLELLANADPLAWPLFATLLFSVGMYPLGFLFGTCSDCCCSNTTCDGFDLEEAYAPRRGGFEACGYTASGNVLTGPLTIYVPHKGCKVVGPGVPDMTFVTNRDDVWGTLADPDGHTTLTLNNAVTGDFTGCATFCGTSGLCGKFNRYPDEGYVFGDCTGDRTRGCVRWICRCYESTGKGQENPETGEPYLPDPADWYTVVSTTIVGGPTTNDLDLAKVLEDALYAGGKFEHYWLDGFTDVFSSEEGYRHCVVYAIVFFGVWATGGMESRDDCYQIVPCTRCQ